MAEKDNPEDKSEAETAEKQSVAAATKAAPKKKRVVKKKSTTKKKAATKKKTAVKKKTAASKKSTARKSSPPSAVVMSASVAKATEEKQTADNAAIEKQVEIQQRLEELGVTPSSSRSKESTSMGDRIFMMVMLGGILFIALIFAYEYGFKAPTSPEQIAESGLSSDAEQLSDDRTMAEETAIADSQLNGSEPATAVSVTGQKVDDSKAVEKSADSSAQMEVSDAKATSTGTTVSGESASSESAATSAGKEPSGVVDAGNEESLIKLDDTFGTSRFSYDTDSRVSGSRTGDRPGYYTPGGQYYPVPPPYGYYPPHPWWPPYLPY